MFGVMRFISTISIVLLFSTQVSAYNQTVNLVNNNTICFQNYNKQTIIEKFLFGNRFLINLTKYSFFNFGNRYQNGHIRITFDEDYFNENLVANSESSNFQVPIFLIKGDSEKQPFSHHVGQLKAVLQFYEDYYNETKYECSKQTANGVDVSRAQICNVFNEGLFKDFASRYNFAYRLMNRDTREAIFKIDGFNNYCIFSKIIHSKDFEYHMDEEMPNKRAVPVKIINEIYNSFGSLKIFDFLNNVIISELFAILLFCFVVSFLLLFVAKLLFGQTRYFWNVLTTYSISYIPMVFVQLYLLYFDAYLFSYIHHLIKNNFSQAEFENSFIQAFHWRTNLIPIVSKITEYFMIVFKIFLTNFIEIFVSVLFSKGYGFWFNNINFNIFKTENHNMKRVVTNWKFLAFVAIIVIESVLYIFISHSNGTTVDKIRILINISKESVLLFIILSNYFNHVDVNKLSRTIGNILYTNDKNLKFQKPKTIINDKLVELNLKLFIKKTLLKYNKTILLLIVKLFFQISLNFIEMGFIDNYSSDSLTKSIFSDRIQNNDNCLTVILYLFDYVSIIGKFFFHPLSSESISNSSNPVIILNRKFDEERIIFITHCLKNGINIFVNFLICLVNINVDLNNLHDEQSS
ncbi:hypothetical protein DASC09_001570 [Saccharomycopsis crataegensis]|uniref:Intimal thickness related receptor IRP domain-containing protein n=1 Tax=Saccharomycopsis crataegensis TaxID=43959 RepID=A0AAV5QDL0_9ASCO|nr:hypothetical protein DASC09_001570 [Saccharomycopsis crataegensis]